MQQATLDARLDPDAISMRRDELQLARSIIANETHFFSFASEANKSGKAQYRDLRDQLFGQEQGYWLRGCTHGLRALALALVQVLVYVLVLLPGACLVPPELRASD